MKKQNQVIINLSPHLFWDVDKNKMDPEINKSFIISRVLEYGLLSDWKIINSYYGIQEIANTAITIRQLNKKAASYISVLSGIPKEKFTCFTSKQSTPIHWIS